MLTHYAGSECLGYGWGTEHPRIDLETQAVHRTCCWTLGTGAGGPDPWLAGPPCFWSMLTTTQDLMEPKSVFTVEKEWGSQSQWAEVWGGRHSDWNPRGAIENKQTNKTCQALLQVLGDPNVSWFSKTDQNFTMSSLLQNTLFFGDLKPIREWLKKLITCYHPGELHLMFIAFWLMKIN